MLRKSQPAKPPQEPSYENAAQITPKKGPVTVIGQHISIQGDIKGKEDLLIEGRVKGSVELPEHHLTVGAKGQVEAAIHADRVTISGTLVGNIAANGKVEITKEADFTGEIKAGRISVEDGAYLKAVVELKRENTPKPIGAPKPVESEPKLGLASGEAAKAKK